MSIGALGSALIGAAGNVVGGVINAFSNHRAADKQYEYQKDLINRQNVFNSPANQMKRLQEAGLNPNLVYGGGNVTGNQSGTGSAPTVQSDGDFGIGAAAQNAINTTMAIDNHDMDMQMKEQEILHKNENHDVILKQAEAQLEKTKTEDKVLKAQLETLERDNAVNFYLGSNFTTSKDSALARSVAGLGAQLTGTQNFAVKAVEFKKKFGYYPSRAELINYVKGGVL